MGKGEMSFVKRLRVHMANKIISLCSPLITQAKKQTLLKRQKSFLERNGEQWKK